MVFARTVESCSPFSAFIVPYSTGLPFLFSFFVWEENLGVRGMSGKLGWLGCCSGVLSLVWDGIVLNVIIVVTIYFFVEMHIFFCGVCGVNS